MNEVLKAQRQLLKLGKKPAIYDPRTLVLEKYTAVASPAPPKEVDWTCGIKDWGMMLNDQIGDCTCAAVGHMVQAWTANGGTERTLPDSAILAAYEAVGAYDPNNPDTDQGASILDVLKYWRTHGIGGDKIGAFVTMNPRNQPMVQLAINWFGGVDVGLELPLSAQDEMVWCQSGDPSENQPGSGGGHSVAIVGYNGAGLTCITWGQPLLMTWGFFSTYCSEVYAMLDADWLKSDAVAPSGLNLAELKADLAQFTPAD